MRNRAVYESYHINHNGRVCYQLIVVGEGGGHWLGLEHRLNMELNLQSLYGHHVHVHVHVHWLRPRKPPPPPAFGLIYKGAIGQPR